MEGPTRAKLRGTGDGSGRTTSKAGKKTSILARPMLESGTPTHAKQRRGDMKPKKCRQSETETGKPERAKLRTEGDAPRFRRSGAKVVSPGRPRHRWRLKDGPKRTGCWSGGEKPKEAEVVEDEAARCARFFKDAKGPELPSAVADDVGPTVPKPAAAEPASRPK